MKNTLTNSKKAKSGINISWFGKSVSGLVVIAGIICIALGATVPNMGGLIFLGAVFVFLGLIGAVFMTAMIKGKF